MYRGGHRNGRRYGELCRYKQNGQRESYHVYDITGNEFCAFYYDDQENIKEMQGFVLSQNLFSFSDRDSLIIINNDIYKSNIYKGSKDLFVTVATPPGLKMNVIFRINGKSYQKINTKKSTVRLSNAFIENGEYSVLVESHLLDSKGKGVNGINIKTQIIKDR